MPAEVRAPQAKCGRRRHRPGRRASEPGRNAAPGSRRHPPLHCVGNGGPDCSPAVGAAVARSPTPRHRVRGRGAARPGGTLREGAAQGRSGPSATSPLRLSSSAATALSTPPDTAHTTCRAPCIARGHLSSPPPPPIPRRAGSPAPSAALPQKRPGGKHVLGVLSSAWPAAPRLQFASPALRPRPLPARPSASLLARAVARDARSLLR